MKLQDRLREYILRRNRRQSSRAAEYPGFDKVKSIAIAFEAGLQDEAILDFIKKMRAEGKEVYPLGYFPFRRKELETIPRFDHFTRTELNWLGFPKSFDITEVLGRKHGVFISLNKKPGSPLEYLSASVNADFTIGLRENGIARFDLLIGSEDQPDYSKIFKEVEYYLRFINSDLKPEAGRRVEQEAGNKE